MSIFAVEDELYELRGTLASMLTKVSGSERVRTVMTHEAPLDENLWRRLSDELGVTGLMIPEEYGGAGVGFAGAAVVLEQLGRYLGCVPYLASSVIAVAAVLECGLEQDRADLLPGLADGSRIATLALYEPAMSSWDVAGVTATVTDSSDGLQVTGEKAFVLDGGCADLFLVVVHTDSGAGLVAVDVRSPGVEVVPQSVLDQTRGLATLRLDAAPARRIGVATQDMTDLLLSVVQVASNGLAMEATGGAQRCLEMAVEYAKTRYQFGRAIGSFQAISHRCVDMLTEVALIRSTAEYAAWCVDHADRSERRIAAATAGSVYSDGYLRVAGDNIQIHGGIGFTWEHDAHLYFKRAKFAQLMFGAAVDHRATLADIVGL